MAFSVNLTGRVLISVSFSNGLHVSFEIILWLCILTLWSFPSIILFNKNFLSVVRWWNLICYCFLSHLMTQKEQGGFAAKKRKEKDYYIRYLQNPFWKKCKADTSCSQIVKTSGSRRAGGWKIDSDVLKKPVKQECGDDLFYNAERVTGESLLCQYGARSQGRLLTPLLWALKR